MGSLDFFAISLDEIGWFIPPYINMGQLESILDATKNNGENKHDALNNVLSSVYSIENISAIFTEKYTVTPFVKDYLSIIDNGIESHFLGLNYASVSTLIPVIEGIARKLSKHRGVDHEHIKKTIINLCESCKTQVVNNKIGDYEEIESMIDSFRKFAVKKLYSDSKIYPHEDNTNRNGITHGVYTDLDFGSKISFYKVISLINFLCFLSAIDAGISWFPPKGKVEGQRKAEYLLLCEKFSTLRQSYS
ncbi:hypothetical protein D3A87_18280 [Vibrio cholerae]|uniref:hypothetical protein n=1 Tax=Vibrio TaxID=662 RepID=UPI001C30E257|nr:MULTISPECIES: hypothetical protein [Vibrio]MCD1189474.1 hypothetical protein [Vibrio cholerae]MCG3738001.1 hypothetical protein [Vibrio cincinnatiensis]